MTAMCSCPSCNRSCYSDGTWYCHFAGLKYFETSYENNQMINRSIGKRNEHTFRCGRNREIHRTLRELLRIRKHLVLHQSFPGILGEREDVGDVAILDISWKLSRVVALVIKDRLIHVQSQFAWLTEYTIKFLLLLCRLTFSGRTTRGLIPSLSWATARTCRIAIGVGIKGQLAM